MQIGSLFGRALAAAMAALIGASPAFANPSIVFDVKTGEVLSHEDAFQRWYPASLSKLMTAYVAFTAIEDDELTLQSPIKMTRHASAEPPSKMGFKPGTEMTLDNALKMMLAKSANDIAMAIAENISGSQSAFAGRMNAEAWRLGMSGSHWVNPNGLFDEQQYTTARDLALLVSAIRNRFPQYGSYFSIEAIGFGKKVLPAYNKLIGRYDGADGMKTGFVCPSGFNLIGTATRDGRTIAAIVLGRSSAKARTSEAAALLTGGFAAVGVKGKPLLASLQSYGQGIDTVANLREEVCEHKAAAAVTSGEAGEESKDKAESPFLHELDHPARVVMVSLGGATGPVPPHRPADAEFVELPVPVNPKAAKQVQTGKSKKARAKAAKASKAKPAAKAKSAPKSGSKQKIKFDIAATLPGKNGLNR